MVPPQSTLHEAWRNVASAAATGPDGKLGAAIRHALGAGVEVSELVDALLSGDRTLDAAQAHERVELEQARRELIGRTYGRIAGDWACGG